MPTEKRRRGRPLGSGKDDSTALAQVADLLAQDSSLKATTAMKCLLRRRNSWGATDTTLIRRWQAKWKLNCEAYLVAAHERARPKAAVSTSALPNRVNFESWRRIQAIPSIEALREGLNSPAVKAMQEYFNSPAAKAMQEYFNGPAAKAIREFQSKIAGVSR